MGRHKKMAAASPPTPASQNDVYGPFLEAAPAPVRKLTRRTLPDGGAARLAALSTVSIYGPVTPLKTLAVQRAALVVAHTPFVSEYQDRKATRLITRVLVDDALDSQVVDEERTLTGAGVARWLARQSGRVTPRSLTTYRLILEAAGRVLYPQQFPPSRRSRASVPRKKAPAAVPAERVTELYTIASTLREGLRLRLLLALDLITGAGLRADEVREVLGTDVSMVTIGPGHDVVVITVRRFGVVHRRVPVISPAKGHRLITRAGEVGSAPLMPVTTSGQVSRNAVNKIGEDLRKLGHVGFDAVGLRNRWIVDLAVRHGVPAAALLRLAGVSDLRALADQVDLLPAYSPEQLAQILLAADEQGDAA
ncbi:hypothetical protein BJF89_10310 [Corynebacterium sp. CNJ-954]|uniref:hypothetical protein n=1 Tax=Corynebacterium sp. CNJ-954 TaxID=1904962 RepID=UPI000966E680|nr:hypothetical protein [Corynebacterium sp. CNJ-954]OLT50298.1 hypothetical protein BJF89_10310 [Corynebacterium sp. CNJ-954]